jgi:membrane protein DedA with SNARE-associated domain
MGCGPRSDVVAAVSVWNAFGGIVWPTAVGLLAYFGGKALADAVSRHGLYAGAAIAAGALLIAAGPRLIHRIR